jgi:low temperature requirement protein LtrA
MLLVTGLARREGMDRDGGCGHCDSCRERLGHVVALLRHRLQTGTRAFEEQQPGHLARVAYTYLHLLIVGGIVLSAVGNKGLIAHPHDLVAWKDAVTLMGGSALFLLGNFLFKNATSRRWPLSHLIGLALLALGVLFSEWLDVLGIAAWAVGVLIVVAALERALLRSRTAAQQGIK